MTEPVEAKARRLLVEGRVRACSAGLALVRGDHGDYAVKLTERGPDCSCPSWKRRCSHALAAGRVLDPADAPPCTEAQAA